MKIVKTQLAGVVLIEPLVFADHRGFYVESFQAERLRAAGILTRFVQEGHSRSRKGVLRGLHYQLVHSQAKLVWVTRGRVFDVAVDIRAGSPSFGRWFATVLDDQSHRQMYIPTGFAHGFQVLSDDADVLYKCSADYHPEDEGGVCWNDPELGIDWPLPDPVLSAKDGRLATLADHDAGSLPRFEPVP